MPHKKFWFVGTVVLAVMVLIPVSSVKAGAYEPWELGGHWFVVTANVAARAVETATGNVSAFATQLKFYISFIDYGPSGARGRRYDYLIYSQVEPGVWEETFCYSVWSSGYLKDTSSYNAQFLPDMPLHIHKQDGTCIYAYVSPHASVVMNLFNGGGEVYDGTNPDETKVLYGTIALTGKVATSLPFVPGSGD